MNSTNNFEMDEMRQQMETLKKKLDAQEIVNDRLMRRSMKSTANKIVQRHNVVMAIGILMIPFGYFSFVMTGGLSIPFWIATCIFMILSAAATYYIGFDLRDSRLMQGKLLEVRRKVARAKKLENQWLFISIPLVILWLAWFVYEAMLQNVDGNRSGYGLLVGGAIGGIIGLIIGFSLHFKTQRQYQEIIDQIEDLTEE